MVGYEKLNLPLHLQTRKLHKIYETRFSAIGQQAAQDCAQGKKENRQGKPMITLIYCLEVGSS